MTLPCATSLSRVAAASALPPTLDKPVDRRSSARTRMFGLFVLIVLCCTVGLVSVASLIQQRDLQLHHVALRSPLVHTEPAAASTGDPHVHTVDAAEWTDEPVDRAHLDEFECVGWVAQRDCDPAGGADAANDRACNATVRAGESGFCALRSKRSGRVHRALRMHCDSLRADVRFTCGDFQELLGFGPEAAGFAHDAEFSLADGRKQLVDDQHTVGVALQHVDVDAAERTSHTPPPDLSRGVLFVVYDKLLESVYASVRALRARGCSLPVELWYKPSETNVAHPLLQALTRDHGCFLREIRDARAVKFYTKMYAVFYSAFDQVLLLDSDNFATRDPTYLFDTDEFKTTGALFWPDFWRPKKTIFNIQPTSFVWEALDLPFVDMFEQESGQVMVDRTKHLDGALQTLMYYAFHAQPLERLRLVWGDKDLFRFAWMQRNASFHMIQTPPGAAGLKLPDQNIFCGVTMVQHDPRGAIVFLHRNQEKLSRDNRELVWHDVQQFRMGEVSIDDYDVRGANGGRYYPQYKRCYGKDIYYEKAFTVTPVQELAFADLEPMLLDFVAEAADIVDTWRARAASNGGGDATGSQQ